MADEAPKTEEKEKAKEEVKKEAQEAPQVCSLSIPTIIAALHQTALAHSNAASKNATITNSALEGDGKDAKLASAGEHIISVIPNEGGVLQKADAIALLSEYVQWFVGPDLKKKVNDSTVKSLTEAPGSKKNESKRFMSFGKFLMLEAEEDDLAAADELFSGEEGGEEDKSTEGEKKEEDKKPEEDKKDEKTEEKDGEEGEVDETKESKTGYYIAYNLKVEGLPQTALKDAMKKFAKTLFDDMKITASGLFGGGDSFTVKDIKDAVNDIFGPIDPNDLVDKVEKEINNIRNPNTDTAQVQVRDKTTLISDLGKNIDAAQKQKISSADYSLWIKLQEYDPKKAIFNPRIVADIVQSSIKGLFKKFKNKITKNDVIYIEDYADIHDDTKSLEQLNKSVPTPQEFTKLMLARNMNVAKVWAQIEKDLDAIAKNKQIKNSVLASGCVKIWEEWKKNRKDDPEALSSDPMDRTTIQKYFQPFIDEYTKFYNKNKDQEDLHESLIILRALNNNEDFKKFVFESMYRNAFLTNASSNYVKRDTLKHDIMSILLEEEPSEGEGSKENEENAMSDEDIKNISSAFKNKLVDIAKDTTTLAIKPFATFGKSEDVLAWLEERGIASSDVKAKLGEFPYAAAHVLKLPKKFNDAGEIDEKNGKLGKASAGYKVYTSDNVKSALESVVNEKIDEPVIEYEATSNGKLKYNKTKIPATCKVRVLLLDAAEQGGEEDKSTEGEKKEKDNKPEEDNKDEKPEESGGEEGGEESNPTSQDTPEGGSGGEGGSKTKRDDVYIIPLPGLKYKDKEHEGTYA